MEIAVVIGLTVLVLGLYFGSNYKQLTQQKGSVEAGRKMLEEQLKLRHKAVDEVGQAFHGKHEQLWSRVTGARAAAEAATTSDAATRATAENELSDALGLYFVELQKDNGIEENQEFPAVRDRIYDMEDAVNTARSDFNTMAARYNMQQHVFPNSVFAQKLGLKEIPTIEFDGAFERHPMKFKGTMPLKKPPIYLQDPTNPKKKQEPTG